MRSLEFRFSLLGLVERPNRLNHIMKMRDVLSVGQAGECVSGLPIREVRCYDTDDLRPIWEEWYERLWELKLRIRKRITAESVL